MKRAYVMGMLPELPEEEIKTLMHGADLCIMNAEDPGAAVPLGFRFGKHSPFGELEVVGYENDGRIALCREVVGN